MQSVHSWLVISPIQEKCIDCGITREVSYRYGRRFLYRKSDSKIIGENCHEPNCFDKKSGGFIDSSSHTDKITHKSNYKKNGLPADIGRINGMIIEIDKTIDMLNKRKAILQLDINDIKRTYRC